MSNTNLRTQSSSVLQNHTVSSCSTSKVQEKTQLSRIKCMNSLRAIQSQLKFLIETLQDFGNMPIFKRTFSQDLDLLENHLTKEIISQTDCKTALTKTQTTYIRPIYDEEPMAEVQLTVECNIFAIGQQHTEQPKIIVESRVDQYPETCQVKNPSCLIASAYNQTTEYSKQSLESENILIKKIVA
ncbi:hypothetical protein Tco_0241647 [Tanacetum coccineum]